jgi:hypothetical protein
VFEFFRGVPAAPDETPAPGSFPVESLQSASGGEGRIHRVRSCAPPYATAIKPCVKRSSREKQLALINPDMRDAVTMDGVEKRFAVIVT